MNTKLLKYSIALGILALPANADMPVAGSKLLSDVAASLEKGGHQLTEASFDDKVWEFDSIKDGKRLELTVDPKSGDIVSSREDKSNDAAPAATDKPLSQIVKIVEAKGYLVGSVDFEKSQWEVDAYKDKAEWELKLSKTGEVLTEKKD